MPGQRAVAPELVEQVAPEAVVGPHPGRLALEPVRNLAEAGPFGHLGAVEHQVFSGPEQAMQVDQRLLLDRVGHSVAGAARSQPAPRDQLGVGRHRGSQVVLQQSQLSHGLGQVRRPGAVEQLGADGDPARVGPGQLVDLHAHQARWPIRQRAAMTWRFE